MSFNGNSDVTFKKLRKAVKKFDEASIFEVGHIGRSNNMRIQFTKDALRGGGLTDEQKCRHILALHDHLVEQGLEPEVSTAWPSQNEKTTSGRTVWNPWFQIYVNKTPRTQSQTSNQAAKNTDEIKELKSNMAKILSLLEKQSETEEPAEEEEGSRPDF